MSAELDLRTIIEFAIDKEQEAVDFYETLAKRTDDDEVITVLHRMAALEALHRDRLQRIEMQALASQGGEPFVGLSLDDYRVAVPDIDQLSYDDLLGIATAREQASANLYADLAASVADRAAQSVFLTLADEERGHGRILSDVWGKTQRSGSQKARRD